MKRIVFLIISIAFSLIASAQIEEVSGVKQDWSIHRGVMNNNFNYLDDRVDSITDGPTVVNKSDTAVYAITSGSGGGSGSFTGAEVADSLDLLYADSTSNWRYEINEAIVDAGDSTFVLVRDSTGFYTKLVPLVDAVSGYTTLRVDILESNDSTIIQVDSTIAFNDGVGVAYTQIPYAASVDLDYRDYSKAYILLTGDITVNLTNALQGTSTVIIEQDGTGRTITKGTGWGDTVTGSQSFTTDPNIEFIIQFEQYSAVDTANFHVVNITE